MKNFLLLDSEAVLATQSLLEALKISVPKNVINEKISNHPMPDSLLSISQSLTDWNIDNFVLKLNPNEFSRATELSFPFISLIRENGDQNYVLINNVSDTEVQYKNSDGVKIENWSNFINHWTGYALLAFTGEESNSQVKNTDAKATSKTFASVIILSTVISVAFLLYGLYSTTAISFLWIIKILGSLISWLLISNEYNKTNSFVQKFCNAVKSDCDKVLNSADSKILGKISFADLGFVYFSGSVILLLLNYLNIASSINLLSIFNLPCLAFSFYSIWYQAVKSKEWCYFCLAIVGLFWLEFAIFVNSGFSIWQLQTDYVTLISVLLSFSLPVAGILTFRPTLEKIQSLTKSKLEMNALKYDLETFQKLIKDNRIWDLKNSNAIRLTGGDNLQDNITLITSPVCKPCFKAHQELESYLNGSYENLSIDIIFTVSPSTDTMSDKYKVAKHITSIYESEGKEAAEQAMEGWYSSPEIQNYETWISKYPVNNCNVDKYLTAFENFCNNNYLDHTPTILFNGREIPKFYSIKDLKYFMD